MMASISQQELVQLSLDVRFLLHFSIIFRSLFGTAVSSARTCWYPLGRITSQLQYSAIQPLLTRFLVITIVWGGLVVFVLVVFWFGVVFFFSFKVLPWKAATLYKNI